MMTIKRINVGSAAKVGAVVTMVTSAIMGLFVFGLQALFFSSMASLISSSSPGFQTSEAQAFGALSLGILCMIYVIYVVLAGIAGGIGGLISAVAYNITAGWIGGLEMEIEGDFGGKAKRRVLDDIYE